MRRRSKTPFTTFSVSVTPLTKAKLKRVADRRYGGSVSALIETIAIQAERLDALARLLDDSPAVSDAEYQTFLTELRSVARPAVKGKRGPAAA